MLNKLLWNIELYNNINSRLIMQNNINLINKINLSIIF